MPGFKKVWSPDTITCRKCQKYSIKICQVRLTPPVVPPKGEVNAADAFDIGNFNEDDTKGIKLTKEDEDHYKNFDIFLPDRWQKEIVGRLS